MPLRCSFFRFGRVNYNHGGPLDLGTVLAKNQYVSVGKMNTVGAASGMKEKSICVRDGIAILHKRFYAGKPRRLAALEKARAADKLARRLSKLSASLVLVFGFAFGFLLSSCRSAGPGP